MWVGCTPSEQPAGATFREGRQGGITVDALPLYTLIATPSAREPHGPKLGSAPHETTLGFVDAQTDDGGLEVMDRVCRKHVANGYIYADPDTGHLQNALIDYGNAAAAEFPLLDRIESAEMIDC